MILDKIKSPNDIKTLKPEELEILAGELREEIITTCSKNGGHIASSLGVTELTIAVLKSFDIENSDKIIWDVGHQSYPYKLLTGRRERFSTLRKLGGISGFPSINESRYDYFGTGHAGTSISAALGMSVAKDLTGRGNQGRIIAVIGDASISNGLALEGLNNAGSLKKDIIVILNDNEMSISKNVGAISNYLNKIMSGDFYQGLRKEAEKLLKSIPLFGNQMAKLVSKFEESFKNLIVPGILFEELGFTYIGPIDGHNIPYLLDSFENIKKIKKPILLHVITKKGKGYGPSEKNPSIFHGVSAFDKSTGLILKRTDDITYGEAASNFLINIAKNNKKIIAITAAMPDGTGLSKFSKVFPERFFDTGIAEGHASTFAAGAAANGLRPFVFIYSTFLQRSLDQIIHDICLQNLPVVLCIDRAGIAGEDGATHQGIFDVSFLGYIPNLIFMSPKNEYELMQMIKSSVFYNAPTVIRYPKTKIPYFVSPEERDISVINEGEFEVLLNGNDNVIISLGAPHTEIIKNLLDDINKNAANKEQEIGLINARFISPISLKLVDKIKSSKKVMTVEENVEFSGFGAKLLTVLSQNVPLTNLEYKIISLGNNYIEHGSRNELLAVMGFSKEKLLESINDFFNVNSEKNKIRYSPR
ncbi:1-deoxy-D-xylulose-5-phosphate synthase [Candidatus Acidulodesulfobacterium sp. H_13]|uniref:1-deoxy-D-xylulose-5-phosphate synthase n=1 Tax=Candidatus Acidulodesulfobacterium sp. H_13 TaxID=3395470 RepID=UPI003AF9ACF1